MLRRVGEPLLLRGPGSVRTFYRWRQVIVVSLVPFVVDVVDTDVTTSDGVTATVSGELQGQVVDPIAAALKVVDYEKATMQIFHTALRAYVGERPAAEIRAEPQRQRSDVTDTVADAVRDWGVVVSSVTFDTTLAAPR